MKLADRVVRVSLGRGADISARAADSVTPLQVAAMKDAAGIVAALLTRGADVNPSDAGGQTPLHWAASWAAAVAVVVLLDHRAGVHARAHDGSRPLDAAASAHALGGAGGVAGPRRGFRSDGRRRRCLLPGSGDGDGALRP